MHILRPVRLGWMMLFLSLATASLDGQQPGARRTPGTARRAKAEAQAVRAAPGVRVEADVAYLGPDRNEKLDVYIPAGAKEGQRFPCVVDIHGGGFMAGDKSDLREQRICNDLAQRGYVAVSLNYYLPEHDQLSGFPRNIHDCKTAIRFLRKTASRWSIDPDHFAAIGGSAGGYFASMLLLTKDGDALDPKRLYNDVSCEIQAAVDMYGPVDLTADPATTKGTVVERFLTRVQSTWPKDRVELLSPAHYVRSGIPPILVTHGEKDLSISISQSERFVALLKKAGATHHYFPIPNAGHSFDLQSSGTDLRDSIVAFFDKYLKGKNVEIPAPRRGERREGTGERMQARGERLSIRNGAVQADFDGQSGRFRLSDLRTGTIWSLASQAVPLPQVKSLHREADSRSLKAQLDTSAGTVDLVMELQDPAEVLVRLIPAGSPRPSDLVYPLPLAPRPQAELVLPVDEGALLPATAIDIPNVLGTYQYRQSGFLMPWFGLVEGEQGIMAMVETPDDLELKVFKALVPGGKDGEQVEVLSPAVNWLSCRGELGYERRMRFCLFDQGGYVAMAKRYRKHLVDTGRFRTLTDKARELPEVNKLWGAIDIHDRSRSRSPADSPSVLDWMIQGGIRRALYYGPLDRQQNEKALAAGYVTAHYDIYTDIAPPELLAVKRQSENPSFLKGYPDEVMVRRDGSLKTGFPYPIRTRDGALAGQGMKTIASATRCSTAKLGWLKQFVPEQSNAFALRARFLDVETATAPNECYSPKHPMTRSEDRQLRTALFDYLRSQGQIAASEGGADWPAQAIHYQEGSLSLNKYSYPKGVYVGTTLVDLPEEYFAIQFNMARRAPLHSLVYHDSLLVTWRWNFTPNRWRNGEEYWDQWDLLHVLYGGMPIFVVDRANVAAKGPRMLQSYRAICEVLEKTAGSEMLAHRFLTPDRQVQETEYANGWQVTVNFDPQKPYRAPEGTTIGAKSFSIKKR